MHRVFAVLPFVSALIAAASTFSPVANAAAQRTFVASYGLPGNSAFNCSISKPCRAFSEAIGVTNSGGEVIVLDSAGYGQVTIGQSISIIAPPGVYGGISVLSGNGINVTGSAIKVVLRGLTINGLGAGAFFTGISFSQGAALTVEDCEISNVFWGIEITAPNSRVGIQNTRIRDAGSGDGILANGSMHVSIEGANVEDHISAQDGALVTITNSVVGGIGVMTPFGGYTDVLVTRSTITDALSGISVSAIPGGFARVVSDGNAINEVGTAFKFYGSGGTEIIYSPGNNAVGFVNVPVQGGALTALTAY